MTRFEVGKKYYMTSACDHNCTWVYEVVRRTAKTVILTGGTDMDAPSRFRISIWNDVECVSPLGTYSMSPSLEANRELIEKDAEPSKEVTETPTEPQKAPSNVIDFNQRL